VRLNIARLDTIDRSYQDTSVVPGDNEGTAGVALAGASAAVTAGANVGGLNNQWEGTCAFAVGDDREVYVIKSSRDATACNINYYPYLSSKLNKSQS
jgi:hypothetical protein